MVTRRPRSDIGQSRRNKKGFRWSLDMKIFLHILHTDFDYSRSENAIIFRSAFSDDVQRHEATNERLEVLIAAQIRERNQMRAKVWVDICRTSLDATELGRRERFRAQIREAVACSKAQSTNRSCPMPARRPLLEASRATAAQSSSVPDTILVERSREAPRPKPQTPLSVQKPIGFWAPSPSIDDEDDRLRVSAPEHIRKMRKLDQRALVPVISRQELVRQQILVPPTPKTPSRAVAKRPVTGLQSSKKKYFRQFHGNTIYVPIKNLERINDPFHEVPEHEAHPAMAGNLYRFWIKGGEDNAHNSEHHFASRRSLSSIQFDQAPRCGALSWEDIYYHIDRIGKVNKKPSPFVSTSNCLVWIIRRALKTQIDHLKEGNHNVDLRITVINPAMLPPKSFYHVPPYFRQLKNKHEFTRGSEKYSATHEFIHWKEISKEAIVHTCSLKAITRLVNGLQKLRRALRFDILAGPGDLKGDICPQLRRKEVDICSSLVAEVAQFAHILGLQPQASIEQLSHLVSDVVQGWRLCVVRRSEEEWSQLASIFADALFRSSGQWSNHADYVKIMRAFREGVFWGVTSHFNAMHTTEHVRLAFKSAKSVGLGDPGKMTANELDAARLNNVKFEIAQRNKFPGRSTQMILDAPINDEGFVSSQETEDEDMEDNDEDDIHVSPSQRLLQPQQQDSDGDSTILYEFGDDGLVV
ncbi:hypothetical protein AC579_3579 [Pseudocercospora musae]|uniref:DUF7587 domain-containing protein n=1 Tax=Pseudocercospora musae TaxID=113226 RepID=A0A139IWF2_9PEZI|nr:hypothetical protein AC579_3579 [Pseudocercospora musae]